MEWLHTDDRYLCQTTEVNPATKERKVTTHYGQSLGGYHREKAQEAAWYLSTGYPWQQIRPLVAPGKRLVFNEPAIQSVIQP
ncbi:hypothetical protein [Hymenobacter profundi]|uniref:Uncharacterized protein n=1 Tax=Hymenobacter profundi TaxID=1982110 RepID=A0ABS6WX04_9BACT|nr:hypothetical protein [Hymenobacter profundi]MBW3128127.1 hypothetical protein [Hymenobacter profundi]